MPHSTRLLIRVLRVKPCAVSSYLTITGWVSRTVIQIFENIKTKFGGLDILVNNAGIYDYLPIENITEESFHKQFNINVLGSIFSHSGICKTIWREGWKYHQYQFRSQQLAATHRFRVFSNKSSSGCSNHSIIERIKRKKYQNQFTITRDCKYGRRQFGGFYRQ